MEAVREKFQNAMNLDKPNAITICQSANLHVKGVGGGHTEIFRAEPGVVSGTIQLYAPGGGPNTAHDWWYSKDNITWVRLKPTINNETLVIGLTPKDDAYFKHERILANGLFPMDGVIHTIVV